MNSCVQIASTSLLAVLIVLFASSAKGQSKSRNVTILLVNGNTGKPMANERLLVFYGRKPSDVSFHKGSTELHTDQRGEASLSLDEPTLFYVQVFVDFKTLCQKAPNERSFAIQGILNEGDETPNNCGKIKMPWMPGKLIVYARSSSITEKMAR